MADAVRFKLEGLADLKKGLEELGTEVATKVGEKADRDAAKVVAEKARMLAPVGDGPTRKTRRNKGGVVVSFDYGRLKDNIRVRKQRVRKQHHIVYAVTIGKAFWGAFQEFGTVNMPARPWLRVAFDMAVPDATQAQITGLREGIARAAKKAARLAKRGR